MAKTSQAQGSMVGTMLRFMSTDALSFTLAFGTSVVVSQTLGPAGRGAGSLLILVATLLSAVLSMGIHEGGIYFSNAKQLRVDSLLTNATLFIMVMAFMVASVVFLMHGTIVVKLGLEDYTAGYYWICLLFPAMLANLLYTNLLLGQKRFADRNIGSIILSLSQFGIVVILVWGCSEGVTGWIAGTTVAYLASSMYALIRLTFFSCMALTWPDPFLLKQSLAYGLKVQIGTLMQMLNYRLDVFFVNYFLGLTSVGIYSVATGMVEVPAMMPYVVGKVLFTMSSNNQETYGDSYTASLCRKTIALMLLVAAGLLSTSWFLVPLVFGQAFTASVWPLVIMIPGSIGIGVYKVLVFGLMGKGVPLATTYSAGPALAITIVLDLILIPLWGVPGAALASTVAYLTCAACTVYLYVRKSNLHWYNFVVPRSDDWNYLVKHFIDSASKVLKNIR